MSQAKSRPMMNLTARMPSVVSSSTSSNLGRTSHGYQVPGKSVAGDDRSGKPERPSPPGYSKEDYGQSWSSQEWKSGAAAHDRSGKPEKISWDTRQQVAPHREETLLDGNAHSVRYGEMIHDGSGKPEKLNHQEEANSETFVMGSDAAELVNKVKDQVRSRQKRMSNVAESGEEHSIIWGMFMAATMNAATFMGKNFSTIQNFIMNSEDLTLKQMFDVRCDGFWLEVSRTTPFLFAKINAICKKAAARVKRQNCTVESLHVVSLGTLISPQTVHTH